MARSISETGRRRISHNASSALRLAGPTSSGRFRSLSLGGRIEVQIESKFRKRFERYCEEDPVFFHPGVVAYDSTE